MECQIRRQQRAPPTLMLGTLLFRVSLDAKTRFPFSMLSNPLTNACPAFFNAQRRSRHTEATAQELYFRLEVVTNIVVDGLMICPGG
jgi:hypothetical protein